MAIWFCTGSICLLALGWEDFQSSRFLTLLPWLMLLGLGRSGRLGLLDVIRSNKLAVYATIALSAWIAVSELTHGFSRAGVRQLLHFLVWIPVAAAVYAIATRERAWIFKLAHVLLLVICVVFGTIVWQRFFLGIPRPPGLGHNVLTGTLVALTGCVATNLLLASPHSKGTLWLVFSCVALCLAAVTINAARAPLVVIVVAALFTAVVFGVKPRLGWIAASAGLATIWIALYADRLLEIQRDWVKYLSGHSHTSLGVRLDAWRWIYNNFDQHPLLGWSVGGVQSSFVALIQARSPEIPSIYPYEHLHSDYLQLLGAYGLPALLLYLIFWFAVSRPSFTSARCSTSDSKNLRMAFALHLFFCMLILVAGFADVIGFWTPTTVAWQTLLGISVARLMLLRTELANR
ncbi:MAG: O-antigen ligase family protein [Burkholderiaceae bacterium]